MATTSTTRKLIEKVTARVFCQLEGGGNPVTIFKSQSPLKPSTQARLAQTCEWESVCVVSSSSQSQSQSSQSQSTNSTGTGTTAMPSMAFYMPTGEQVSFCAHAAMGGALQLGWSQTTPEQPLQFTAAALTSPNDSDSDSDSDSDNHANATAAATTPYTAIVHEHDIVSLEMEADFTETAIPHRPTLHRIIRDCCGLESSDLTTTSGGSSSSYASSSTPAVPTFCNSSIARPKTLVYVNSVEALGRAKPPAPSAASADAFRKSCDAVESTGLYLYTPAVVDVDADVDDNDNSNDSSSSNNTKETNDSWECRQFPRASGYPEDPATGIAAAALAASLYFRGTKLPAYKFYQGTAMGQPSLIMVENMKITNLKDDSEKRVASFRLLGRIEVDQRDELEVDDE
jgi:hypothetical protein